MQTALKKVRQLAHSPFPVSNTATWLCDGQASHSRLYLEPFQVQRRRYRTDSPRVGQLGLPAISKWCGAILTQKNKRSPI
ncbi:hypothetical protein [Aquaspirillum soli]